MIVFISISVFFDFAGFVRYLNSMYDVYMPPSQDDYCTLTTACLRVSSLCSTLFILNMTFERFYSIIRPHKAASFNTVKRARIIIVCIFVTYFIYCILFVFITGNRGKNCISNKFASVTVLGEF